MQVVFCHDMLSVNGIYLLFAIAKKRPKRIGTKQNIRTHKKKERQENCKEEKSGANKNHGGPLEEHTQSQ